MQDKVAVKRHRDPQSDGMLKAAAKKKSAHSHRSQHEIEAQLQHEYDTYLTLNGQEMHCRYDVAPNAPDKLQLPELTPENPELDEEEERSLFNKFCDAANSVAEFLGFTIHDDKDEEGFQLKDENGKPLNQAQRAAFEQEMQRRHGPESAARHSLPKTPTPLPTAPKPKHD